MDDGDLFTATIGMIGLSFLAMLNEIDQANLLEPDSRIKDLGLVMACYIQWSEIWNEFGSGDGVDWPKEIVAYAKKAGIELGNAGIHGIRAKLTSTEKEHGEIRPLAGDAKADRWTWKKKVSVSKKPQPHTYTY